MVITPKPCRIQWEHQDLILPSHRIRNISFSEKRRARNRPRCLWRPARQFAHASGAAANTGCRGTHRLTRRPASWHSTGTSQFALTVSFRAPGRSALALRYGLQRPCRIGARYSAVLASSHPRRPSVSSRIAGSRAMMEITTSNSISVKPPAKFRIPQRNRLPQRLNTLDYDCAPPVHLPSANCRQLCRIRTSTHPPRDHAAGGTCFVMDYYPDFTEITAWRSAF
jgi:hypothetical protein